MKVAGILVLSLVGCGPVILERPSNEQLGDAVGEQSNLARKHLSDRGLTVEAANERAVDKGFTREPTEDKLLATRKNAGAEANRSRKDLYGRGIQEMRHGDQTVQDRLTAGENASEANAEAIAATNVKLASYVSLLQAQLDEQSEQLSSFKGLVATEFEATTNHLNSVADGLGDEIAAVVRALAVEEASRIAAVEAAIAAGTAQADALESLIDDLDEALGVAIEDLEQADRMLVRRLCRTNRSLSRLSRTVRSLSRRVRVLENVEYEDEVCEISTQPHPFLPFGHETILSCPSGTVNLGWSGFPF